MKRKITGIILLALLLSVLLAGCVESKAAKDARLQGVEQMKNKDYAGAIASLDTALREADGVVNKFELDILKYRGEAEYALEDYEAAFHTYEILLDVDGEKAEYLYSGACALARAGNPEKAVEMYERASVLEKDQKDGAAGRDRAFMTIGKAFETKEDFEGARRFYQNAVDKGRANAQTYNLLGLSLLKNERYDEAIKSFESGLAFDDAVQKKELEYNKAAAFEYKGDFGEALRLFQEYAAAYGSTPELDKEIAFLKSR